MRPGAFGFPLQTTEETISLLTGSGYYVVPLWARFIRVRACGGGGGGGGADGAGQGASGSASGFVAENIFPVIPGIRIPYSCGLGGNGGSSVASSSPGNNGSNGNDTTFGESNSTVYLIARGGRSGKGGAAVISVDGRGSNAGTNIGQEQAPANTDGHAGGPSPLTGVVALGSTTNNVAGQDGEYGGGGGGGKSQTGSNGSPGGQGGQGWIQVEAIL